MSQGELPHSPTYDHFQLGREIEPLGYAFWLTSNPMDGVKISSLQFARELGLRRSAVVLAGNHRFFSTDGIEESAESGREIDLTIVEFMPGKGTREITPMGDLISRTTLAARAGLRVLVKDAEVDFIPPNTLTFGGQQFCTIASSTETRVFESKDIRNPSRVIKAFNDIEFANLVIALPMNSKGENPVTVEDVVAATVKGWVKAKASLESKRA